MIFLYQTFTKFITFLPRIKAKVSLLFLYCYLCPQGEITTLYIIVDFKSVAFKKKFYSFFLLFQWNRPIEHSHFYSKTICFLFYFLNRGYFPCHGQTGPCSTIITTRPFSLRFRHINRNTFHMSVKWKFDKVIF
jgi:hypothetical protein